MTFPLDDIFDGVGDPNAPHPATFGKRGDLGGGINCAGIIWHTTEAAGFTRAHATGTATWQRTNPGSYNWIIYDGGLLLTVPYLEASGGINPASASYHPERYPWLKELLGKAYSDPNKYLLNVAFSGRTADMLAGKVPPNMYTTAAKLARWVEQQAWGADNQVFSGHMHWQTNRSDPGQATIDRILSEYHRLYSAPAKPPPPPDYEALYEAEVAKVTDLTTKLKAARSELAAAEDGQQRARASFAALQEQAASDLEGLSVRAADSAKRIRSKKP